QPGRELRRTIIHCLVVLATIPLLFSALLSAMPNLTSDLNSVPEWLATVLNSKYIFILLIILGTIPALFVTALIYLVLRSPISDLAFIYFNVLTAYVL